MKGYVELSKENGIFVDLGIHLDIKNDAIIVYKLCKPLKYWHQ